jgi:ubiquinol-cytochrome c reductase cytochrome c subunit
MRTVRGIVASPIILVALPTLVAGLTGSAGIGPWDAHSALEQPQGDAQVEAGRVLYQASCVSCHGPDGAGTAIGPPLTQAGAASADFQLSTGRMPFAGPPGTQTRRKPPAFTADQRAQLVAYVASIGQGPDIPSVTLDERRLASGQELFVGNCAPCHGATGNGGAVGGGSLAPPLGQATSLQVAEAMLTGPGQMPVFDIGPDGQNAVATYVDDLQHAPQPGGFSIGGIGPVPEGFVAWVVGIGLMLIIVYLIGRRWDRAAGGPNR